MMNTQPTIPPLYDPGRTDEAHRTAEFRKSATLEQLLAELNGLLAGCQAQMNQQYTRPRFPLVLIVGLPRSGTTLFLQWLAESKQWGYPSNIISWFFGAPYIGARVQQVLVEHDYKHQITDFQKTDPYASSLGTTKGATAPHEFWYFWRRFFPFSEDCEVVPPEALAQIDVARLNAELATLEAALAKPLAMKAMLLNQHIPFLDAAFERVLFVHVQRDPLLVMQSIMEGRLKNFGTEERWYSLRPPEYRWLKDLDPVRQVAGQVHFISKAVAEGLAQVAESRKMAVDYERFCQDPAGSWEALRAQLAAQGHALEGAYQGPERFEAATGLRVSPERRMSFQAALAEIAAMDSQP
ncbi:MAG: sulfotransferase [Chloroflexi bacterium]|nr:sulfotransferase [Chloroflexota bacterium]